MDYAECARCGAVVVLLRHALTGSTVMIDPLPPAKGNLVPDFVAGTWQLVRKDRPGLWQAHVSSCPAFH